MVRKLQTLVIVMALFASLTGNSAAAETSAHDFSFESIDGGSLPMSSFAGQTVMVVNTASFCGFTRQYKDLQALWETYRDRGFVVLGVPSNDFGAQEPGTEGEIKEFCELNYGIDFPMTTKEIVKGSDAHPFYQWAAAQLGSIAKPRWNFHKYLVGPDGQLVDWFSTATSPSSSKVKRAVEGVLEQ